MSRLGSLQVLRALAALAVALLHFQAEAESMAAASGQAFAGVLMKHLAAGVDLFFVISGFVMVYASKGLFERPGAAGAFLMRRIARIVPLYWAMTTLFLAGLVLSPSLSTSGSVLPLEIIKSYLFVPYVAANTGLIQPVYKLGWTLNYEMTFYLAFSLFLFLPMRKAVPLLAGLFSLMVVAGQLIRPAPGALAFWTNPIILEFAFGAVIAQAYLAGVRISMAMAALSVLAGITLLALSPGFGVPLDGPLRPLVWGLPAALILAGTLLAGPLQKQRVESAPATPSRTMKLLEKMGDASYAIYLVHPVIFRGLRALWEKAGLGTMFPLWGYVVSGMAMLILVSILVYQWFEAPLTRAAQQRLRQRASLAP
jgi:exopolysaccharide production protein ExoZ